jgi:GDYXXLXY protein
MTNLQNGLILAGAQLALVASLAGKYAIDRARLPRVWVQTAAYDPSLPIRGRYVQVRLRLAAEDAYGNTGNFSGAMHDVTLKVKEGHLVANLADHPTGLHISQSMFNRGEKETLLVEPVAFFLPEHAADPSLHTADQELWVEVTVPKTGPPRPIRLATKRGDTLTPLDIR